MITLVAFYRTQTKKRSLLRFVTSCQPHRFEFGCTSRNRKLLQSILNVLLLSRGQFFFNIINGNFQSSVEGNSGLLVLTLSPHWLVLMLIFVLICHWSKGAKRLILRLKRIEKNFPNNRRKRRTVMYFSRVPICM